jgi:FkbM family methyltransferase
LPDWNYAQLNCVFDVGAHLGKFARKITSNNPDAVVHLFEPNGELITTLRKNFDSEKCIINEVALSNFSGVNIFHHNRFDETNSLLKPAQVSPDIDSLTVEEFESEVETLTLDQYANSKQINRIDLLKIDAQGLGFEVLEGAHCMLSKKAIDKIWVEVEFIALYKNQKYFRDVDNLLKQYGYVLHNLYNLKFAGKNLGWCDAYYILSDS